MPNILDNAIDQWRNQKYDECFPIIESYAENGNENAQFVLGEAYWSGGWGKEKNIDLAIQLFKKALKGGHLHAAIRLAYLFDPDNPVNKENVGKNSEEATYYYELAFKRYLDESNNGNAEAMYALSNCYFNGHGVHYNIELAKKWQVKSCESGYMIACDSL